MNLFRRIKTNKIIKRFKTDIDKVRELLLYIPLDKYNKDESLKIINNIFEETFELEKLNHFNDKIEVLQ